MNSTDFAALTILCILLSNCLVNGLDEKALRDYLINSVAYDKLVRPVLQSNQVVPVEVQLMPIALREVDDAHHMFKLDTWLAVHWQDRYMIWDPKTYGGLEEFRLPATEVWVPDVTILSGTPETAIPPKNTNVVISNEGNVVWVPPFTIKNHCPSLRFRNLRANCTISLLSWTYDITQLDINLKNETSMEYFEKGFPGWFVESVSSERILKYFSCCPKPYPVIQFYITLRRTFF